MSSSKVLTHVSKCHMGPSFFSDRSQFLHSLAKATECFFYFIFFCCCFFVVVVLLLLILFQSFHLQRRTIIACLFFLTDACNPLINSLWCSMSYGRTPLQYCYTEQISYSPTCAPCRVEELLCSTRTHNRVGVPLLVLLVV